MLSVSGARGIVGKTMTPVTAAEFAAAFGSFVRERSGQMRPRLCVGRDSRPSGQMLASAAMAGLASVGCEVIELGVVTTPSVAVMIGHHGAAGGMVVTASHNPIQWNGLKCLNADGVAPPPTDANEIIARFKEKEFSYADVEQIPQASRDDTTHRRHVELVLPHVDVQAIRKKRFRVVLDSVNGAGCVAGRMLLDELGCDLVHLNGEPTGFFAHTPEPVEKNLEALARTTNAEGAAAGFAQDPDADRLAIIDENGRFIGEEYTLVLAAMRVLEREAGAGRKDATLAANLSTSRMIDDVAARFGAKVLRTAVGEANVVAAMKPAASILGGEGNGGVIFPPVCWVRDSLISMALVLDLLAASGKSLSTIVDALPRYAMIKHTFDLAQVGGAAAVKPAIERVVKRFAGERMSTVDGVRIDLADVWVHLRPSNTEPIVRLIAEAATRERAWELIDEVAVAGGLGSGARPR